MVIGTLLDGTYRVESVIGRGGMGVVYKAHHERLRRHFALKVLDVSDEERGPRLAERFRREAHITAALAHPHIVAVSDYNVTRQGSPYLVMELLKGEDLASYLRRKPKLPIRTAALILQQLAAAVQSAHDAGVVHRDLKPSNVFLCRQANDDVLLKVLDFGISKVAGTSSSMTLTQQLIGTPAFMAPEQAQGDSDNVDHRADIFSVGAMLYLMLAGAKPFSAESVPKMLFKVVYEQPPPLLDARTDLSQAVVDVVSRALNKNPEDRQPSIAVLWRDFREAAGLEGSVASLAPSRWRLTQKVDLNALGSHADGAVDDVPSLFGAETQTSAIEDGAGLPAELVGATLILDKTVPEPARPLPTPEQTPPAPATRGLGWRFWAPIVSGVTLVAVGSLLLGLNLATHNLATHNLATHNQATHNQATHNQATHNQATQPSAEGSISTGPAKPDTIRPTKDTSPQHRGRDGAADVRMPRRRDGEDARSRAGEQRWRSIRIPRRPNVRRPRRPNVRRPRRRSAGTATLRVSVTSSGHSVPAQIYLDGQSMGQAPLMLKSVKTGRHRITARHGTMKPQTRHIRLRNGKEQRVVFRLRRR